MITVMVMTLYLIQFNYRDYVFHEQTSQIPAKVIRRVGDETIAIVIRAMYEKGGLDDIDADVETDDC